MTISRGRLRIGVDVGGTFTDVSLYDDDSGRIWGAKVPTDVAAQDRGMVTGIEQALADAGGRAADVSFVGHGTTVALNALLERKGARIAFLTTAGFRDVLELARQQRPELYNFFVHRPPPLAPRERRFEVAERTSAEGEILTRVSERALAALIRRLRRDPVDALAIAFLNSYRNPENERRAKAILEAALPGLPISCSHEIAQEFREFERFSSVAMNAYLLPKVARYMRRLEQTLPAHGLRPAPLIFQSNGAVMAASLAAREPVRTLMSGPAGGVLGAAYVATAAGFDDVITFDMGGTSTDVALIEDGKPSVTSTRTLDGYPVISPSFDVRSIGAGGGSIAWVDAGRFIKVGPRSAGAEPGPACYGRGGEDVTVTDADMALGYLNPAAFLGGRMPVDHKCSLSVLERLAASAGLDVWTAAAGVVQIVTANIARLVRLAAFERGRDPRDFTLVAFGGAGPLHAGLVARELGMRKILVPAQPGLLCAVGMLVADLRADFSKTLVCDMRPGDTGVIGAVVGAVQDLQQRGKRAIAEGALGAPAAGPYTRLSFDLRYKGQNYEITVPVREGREAAIHHEPAAVLAEAGADFHRLHERIYGHASADAPVQLVTVRFGVGIAHPKPRLAGLAAPSAAEMPSVDRRSIRLVEAPGVSVDCLVRARHGIEPGETIAGPAIIEQMDSTSLVLRGQVAVADSSGNLVISETGS